MKLPKQEIIIHQSMSSSSSRKRDHDADQNFINDRNRRAKMNQNFSVLQSMVPTLVKSFKPPKDEIIIETTKYIKYLEQETKRLEILKKCKPNSVLAQSSNHNSCKKFAVSDATTFLAIQLPVKRGLIPEIVKVLEKNRAEVLEARFSVDDHRILTFTATIMLNGGNTIDKIKEELMIL